ncbi:MAG: glycosyltransferase family 39 protein, partial [Lysobacter sp.]|nr:glycosyltransferase family 39 protein [Lysobacter sp.]
MPRLGAVATAGLLAALALAVSVSTIGHESLWFDEGVTLRIGRYGRDLWFEHLFTREPFWALYYAGIRPVIEVTDNLVLLRLPSALAAAGTVGLTYLVGRRLVGRRAAMAGALVLVPHGFLLQYAQEARGYAPAAFLMVACTFVFVLACERPSWRRWLLYALLAILAVYAHFFAAFVIAAQFLALGFRGRAWIRAHWHYPAVAFVMIGVAAWPLANWLLAAEQTRRFVRAITPDRIIATFAWFGGANVMPHNPLYYLLG